MKKYIVAINESTKDKDNAFLEYIKSNKFNWWHWIDNFWIILDYKENSTTFEIRDKVTEIYDCRSLVLEIDKKSWGGFGPNSDEPGGKNMFNWIKNNLE